MYAGMNCVAKNIVLLVTLFITMYRHEDKGIFVRYDGTETRVNVNRAKNGNGLSCEELKALIDTLSHAYDCRKAFEAEQ